MSLKPDCLRIRSTLVCRQIDGKYHVTDTATGEHIGKPCNSATLAWWNAYAALSRLGAGAQWSED